MAQVLAAFAPAASSPVVPASASFNGNAMNLAGTSEAGTDSYVGVGLFYKDVTAGESGTISVTWPGDNDERIISAVVLSEALQSTAPEAIETTFNNSAATTDAITTSTDGAMVVSGVHRTANATLSAVGTNHTLQAETPSTDSAGGIGSVSVSTAATVSGIGFGGTTTMMAQILAAFAPEPISTAFEVSQNGCANWQDYDMQFDLKHDQAIATTGSTGMTLRFQSSTQYYSVRLYCNDCSDANPLNHVYKLQIIKNDSGETVLAESTTVISQSTFYTIKGKVEGSDISAKIWQTSSSEPGSWTLTTTDATYTSGKVGIITDQGEAQFDDVAATPIT